MVWRFNRARILVVFLSSLAIFVVAHLVLPIPPIRNRLIAVLGRRGYLLGYSLLSLGLITWVIIAATNAPYVGLWPPQAWHTFVPLVAVPFGAWLLLAGLTQPNPLSIAIRRTDSHQLGGIVSVTRHPVLWGFLLWAASHLVANGDLVSVILFGGLSLLALAGFGLADARARRRLGTARWSELASSTSIVPFSAVIAGRARLALGWRDLITAVTVLAVTTWFVLDGHRLLIGVDPMSLV